jgi:hypothetical protein
VEPEQTVQPEPSDEPSQPEQPTEPEVQENPAPVPPEQAEITETKLTCTLEIRCDKLIGNADLDPDKVELIPEDGVLFADMDLPEIEHLPSVKARQLASGQVKEAAKSQKELKAEYARCVFGLGMFCASYFFCVTPHMEKILLSAYTQRRNSKGDVEDTYIYSVIFDREAFEQPGYQQTDPEAFICRFKNRMNKLADGTLKRIEPFGPEAIEAQE